MVESLYDLYPPAFSKLIGHFYDNKVDKSIHIKELNCIYIPIPKVGTKSIKKVFADYLHSENSDKRFDTTYSNKKQLPFHRVPKSSLDSLKNNNFIFSFVRNPYDRILSCYFDKINKKTSYIGFLRYQGRFYRGMSFEDFIEEIATIPDSDADQHFRSQFKFLVNENDELIPHFVGQLENMSADFKTVIKELSTDKLELTHLNRSKARKIDYSEYFTPKITELIQERYEKDFQLFGYSTEIEHYV
ncbi:MAG: sulfotransferase family 2 domain-containing protein [Balneolaceae bacterium]|nr:sulfotransferase family 2 domain-containing protein [Balneolaceae bacterium]